MSGIHLRMMDDIIDSQCGMSGEDMDFIEKLNDRRGVLLPVVCESRLERIWLQANRE